MPGDAPRFLQTRAAGTALAGTIEHGADLLCSDVDRQASRCEASLPLRIAPCLSKPIGIGMFLELDGQGPHYAQLTRAMKEAILDGRIVAGSRLPPTRVLANDLDLSRTTVLAAYEQLRAEGFIDARVGSGSYVTTLQPGPPLQSPARQIPPPSLYVWRVRARCRIERWRCCTGACGITCNMANPRSIPRSMRPGGNGRAGTGCRVYACPWGQLLGAACPA